MLEVLRGLESPTLMSERDDDIIEFDFFEDEPDTQQTTQRRSARPGQGGGPPRTGGPRRPTFRGPEGVTPLLRLILLIALAIFVVIVLVFWVQSCRSASKTEAYQDLSLIHISEPTRHLRIS